MLWSSVIWMPYHWLTVTRHEKEGLSAQNTPIQLFHLSHLLYKIYKFSKLYCIPIAWCCTSMKCFIDKLCLSKNYEISKPKKVVKFYMHINLIILRWVTNSFYNFIIMAAIVSILVLVLIVVEINYKLLLWSLNFN